MSEPAVKSTRPAFAEPAAATTTAKPPTPAADGPLAGAADGAAQVLEVADEAAALVASIGRLASAEASLSLTALSRSVGLRFLALVLFALALVFVATASVLALVHWLDSLPAALAIVGCVVAVGGALLSWRASIWRARIGFKATRAALDPIPSARAERKS
jgi:uncharacterized integral membrane protein